MNRIKATEAHDIAVEAGAENTLDKIYTKIAKVAKSGKTATEITWDLNDDMIRTLGNDGYHVQSNGRYDTNTISW